MCRAHYTVSCPHNIQTVTRMRKTNVVETVMQISFSCAVTAAPLQQQGECTERARNGVFTTARGQKGRVSNHTERSSFRSWRPATGRPAFYYLKCHKLVRSLCSRMTVCQIRSHLRPSIPLFTPLEAFYFLKNGGGAEICDMYMYQISAFISSGDLTCHNGIGGV